MRHVQIACLVVVSAAVAFAQGVAVAPLVDQLKLDDGTALSDQAFGKLRLMIRSSDAVTVDQLRRTLLLEFESATAPVSIRRIGQTLSAAPSDELLSIALSKLEADPAHETTVAVCDVIASIGSDHKFADSQLVDLAISRLEQVLRDDSAPGPLLDSALLAMSSLGQKGMDGLLKMRSTVVAVKSKSNVFYSALARTGDVRALRFLRDGLTDLNLRHGLQIQAASAMGQMAAKIRSRNVTLQDAELNACIRALQRTLNSTDDDQLFGAALKTLAKLQGVQPNSALHETVIATLYSTSQVRQEAALEAIYAADCDLVDAGLVEVLRPITQSDDESLAATATAVLDKCDANDVNAE